jgi:hypothetical protein
MTMRDYDEERIGELLAALQPAPDAWLAAAEEIPRTRRELTDIMRRLDADEEFRRAVQADITTALGHFGYVPDPQSVEALRRRLDDLAP